MDVNTIEKRKSYLTKDIDKLKYEYNRELVLGVEGRLINLLIWIGNEKCLAKGGGKRKIFMRLDMSGNYSCPLNEKSYRYLCNPPTDFEKLLKFGFISDMENLDEILNITKNLKHRKLIMW